jgi:shikimate kinase
MKSNLALIGFMGAGKSAVGKVLAEKLGKQFIELDELLEKRAGKSISRIFAEEGEIAFREKEIETIKEIAARKDQVISCGGGAVLNKINMDRLKPDSLIIWLMASPEVIWQRTRSQREERPLLKGKNCLGDIQQMLRLRKPYYEGAADIIVNTSRLSIERVTELVLKELAKNADFNSKK